MKGIIVGIPGKMPITDFEELGGLFSCVIENPKTISSLYVSLIQPLQEGLGVGLYYSLPPYDGLHFMAVIANAMPSQIVSTGFALKQEVANLPEFRLVL